MTQTGYLAAQGFEAELEQELKSNIRHQIGRLFVTDGQAQPAAWAANIWHNLVEIPIRSIGDGAAQLRALQRNWVVYGDQYFRRAQLIQDRLPHVSAKPLIFPQPLPIAPLGSWTLATPDLILAAPHCESARPHGEYHFVEDKMGPPNRAYLKLWEALTRIGRHPKPGELCLDLGASPGGWTWVLAQLGVNVISIDKAPLDPQIMCQPNVTWRQDSAFALKPSTFGPVDWLFCDVICYPQRLYGLVQRWLMEGKVRNFICTIKFQGETDFQTLEKFSAIEHSHLVHLFHNKHELTWILLRDNSAD